MYSAKYAKLALEQSPCLNLPTRARRSEPSEHHPLDALSDFPDLLGRVVALSISDFQDEFVAMHGSDRIAGSGEGVYSGFDRLVGQQPHTLPPDREIMSGAYEAAGGGPGGIDENRFCGIVIGR